MKSALLRMLLCLCLILDQSAAAMASLRMQIAQASHAHMGMSAGMRAAGCGHDGEATARHAMPTQPALPDCCKSGLCDCACAMQAAVAVATIALPDVFIAHAGASHPLIHGHSSPALTHLIRPPIG